MIRVELDPILDGRKTAVDAAKLVPLENAIGRDFGAEKLTLDTAAFEAGRAAILVTFGFLREG